MHPAPIKITPENLPANAVFLHTLDSGERIYRFRSTIYAVQPTSTTPTPTRENVGQ